MDVFINGNIWSKWFSRVALGVTLFVTVFNAFAGNINVDNAFTPARVTLERNGTQLIISTSTAQWQVPFERFSILGNSASIQRALYDIPYFYRGHVLGKENSWVRINSDIELPPSSKTATVDVNVSGHIFIDDALFKLQHHEKTGHSLVAISNSSANTNTLKAGHISQQQNSSRLSAQQDKVLPLKAIQIGILIDSRYNDFHNGGGLNEALKIINGVDGLFQDQLGLAIIVERFKSEEDPQTDPLRHYSGNMEQMLNEFRQIRRSDDEFPADLALVHLFTGHSDPDKLIGVSWIDTVCQVDGYDLSISTPYPNGTLLSAHEIAHNLGAFHDDDQQCLTDASITGSQVMWSELSNFTQTNFSSCSLDAMRHSLSSSCVLENIDMALTVKTTPTSFSFEQQVEVSAINWDITRTSGQVSSITRFPESTQLSNQGAGCVLTNTTMTCQHGNISADSQSIYSVTALLANAGAALISSELYFSDFTDSNGSDNRADVQVSLTEEAISQTPQLTNMEISNDGDNRAAVSSAGVGSFGPLDIIWLSLLWRFIYLNKRAV
ncbi:MAG: hypothetical protein ACI8VW_004260 [bacterium]|jgi:hypothetical protein